ncbi:c-type cytochrome [Hydrogenophaga sp. RWCD_12]|uniref:c-type cytochrome n=1 Tax=Hydrogenophaga sp. RWCD_12 TaxID=3391190 RepID=UPI00398497D7
MNRKMALIGVLSTLMSGTALAQSVDSLQVRSWAAACANCHGTNGHAQAGNASLAGVSKDDLVKKLMDFKSGHRPATIMHQLSKGYSDEQLNAIAGYFASIKK